MRPFIMSSDENILAFIEFTFSCSMIFDQLYLFLLHTHQNQNRQSDCSMIESNNASSSDFAILGFLGVEGGC